MAGAQGDRGELAGLRSRLNLNGRRVEVRGTAPEKHGAPRFRVELLFGAGAGTVMKVKAANLELDKDRVLDPALNTLAAAMQALAPGAAPEEEWRDWAGLPEHVLVKVAGKLIAQIEAGWAAYLKRNPYWTEERIKRRMAERKRKGNCLFVFAMVCKPWRKAQLKVGGPLRSRVWSDVILPGGVALAKWALAEGCPREEESYRYNMAHAAASFGHTKLVKWLCGEGGFAMDEGVMNRASHGGNLELVQWLRGKGCDWGAKTCMGAAQRGRLEVLQWLRVNGCPWDAETCVQAALGGHLETLRWARENGCDWDADSCVAAAQGGQLDVLQWLRVEGCPWDARTCSVAARHGHLATLRWARENGCDWDAGTCYHAAGGGQLEILQWLRAEGCPWNEKTCSAAAEFGHLETLRWARENGCDWDARTCSQAAYGGHLEVLQWLRAEGCPWNHNTCKFAVKQRHVKVLRWARENGCLWNGMTKHLAFRTLGYKDNLGNLGVA